MKIFITSLLFILSAFMMSKSVYGQTLIIDDSIDQVSAVPYLSILENSSHELTIEQIVTSGYQNQFKTHTAEHLNMGHNKSSWWLKLEVAQQTSQSWYALIDFIPLSRADAFLIPARSEKITYLGNIRKEFAFQRLPMVRLPENETYFTLYIRIENHGHEVLLLPIKMFSADALHEKNR